MARLHERVILAVFTNPTSAEADAAYNDWYDNVHLDDVVAVPGFVAAQRYRLSDTPASAEAAPSSHAYMALYEVEGDVEAAARGLAAAAGTADMTIDPSLDVEHALAHFWEPLGERVTKTRTDPPPAPR